jgi:hypothetical protein
MDQADGLTDIPRNVDTFPSKRRGIIKQFWMVDENAQNWDNETYIYVKNGCVL